jgi:hypothetical protein
VISVTLFWASASASSAGVLKIAERMRERAAIAARRGAVKSAREDF